jgi:hypothetical protein
MRPRPWACRRTRFSLEPGQKNKPDRNSQRTRHGKAHHQTQRAIARKHPKLEAKRGRSPPGNAVRAEKKPKNNITNKKRERMRSGLQPTRATNRQKPRAGDSPLRSALELEGEGGSKRQTTTTWKFPRLSRPGGMQSRAAVDLGVETVDSSQWGLV